MTKSLVTKLAYHLADKQTNNNNKIKYSHHIYDLAVVLGWYKGDYNQFSLLGQLYVPEESCSPTLLSSM